MRRHLILTTLMSAAMALSVARADPIKIVAAEKVYGALAQQIGGSNVAVTSVLTNPNQDPHDFEVNASTARQIADAKLVVYNGADYDPWMTKLLSASRAPSRKVIEVARLVNKRAGDNPHVWYDPKAISALTKVLADTLSTLDPIHRTGYAERHAAFERSMRPLVERIAELRKGYAGSAVTATEPVFGYMADALGLKMLNGRFQLAVMNGTEPSAKDIAAFEKGLRTRTVKVLFYNSQTSSALAERMRTIAASADVPVVGVTETQPQGMTYQQWMLSQLDALGRALGEP
ncbi:MAG: cation ABC transporter substrate-binding protein [Betaproteobacteria bacterium RIFCSPLOWO2_12_FULL_66_14]|nr:MAG: cation ABC transporter substrate-binding protein [Betaproteobacteria bacterium RIFCSPLOWO2_12_FULL_66_14]